MIKKLGKYFTIFGILAATVNRTLHSVYCIINTITIINLPKITKILLSKQLKPIKSYSSNYIYR